LSCRLNGRVDCLLRSTFFYQLRSPQSLGALNIKEVAHKTY
jgi:hypothetical protein